MMYTEKCQKNAWFQLVSIIVMILNMNDAAIK